MSDLQFGPQDAVNALKNVNDAITNHYVGKPPQTRTMEMSVQVLAQVVEEWTNAKVAKQIAEKAAQTKAALKKSKTAKTKKATTKTSH